MVTFASLSRLVLAASLMGLVSTAHAQTAAPFTPSMPPASYQSVFKDYKPYLEEPVGNWKAANDDVARIGGWREYARQAQELEPKSANTPASKPAETPPSPGIKAKP